MEMGVLSLWPIQSCLFAETVNKGPIDKDGTFIKAKKPAETGKVLKLACCFHVYIGSVSDKRDYSLNQRRYKEVPCLTLVKR